MQRRTSRPNSVEFFEQRRRETGVSFDHIYTYIHTDTTNYLTLLCACARSRVIGTKIECTSVCAFLIGERPQLTELSGFIPDQTLLYSNS